MAIVNELAASKITEEIKLLRSCPHSERRCNDQKGKVKTLGAAIAKPVHSICWAKWPAARKVFPFLHFQYFFCVCASTQLTNNNACVYVVIHTAPNWFEIDFCGPVFGIY
jgi:hypothetical protein